MRKTIVKHAKSGLLPASAGALLAFSVFFTAAPAQAGFSQNQDNAQLVARINQLENQVQTLSRAVYRSGAVSMTGGGASAGGGDSASASIMTNFEDRLSQLEQQQRQMTGQLEQMTYQIQQMQQKLDKAQADNEMRLQQLEGGGHASSGSASSSTSYAEPPVTAYQGGAHTAQRGKLLGTMSSSGGPDNAETLYQSAFADVRAAHYETAAGKFRDFMGKYPTHPLASNAQYWLGETYYVRGDYHEAAKLFAQDYQNYPQGGKASASLLKLGMSLAKLGKKGDACLSFKQLKKEFPAERSPENRAADEEMRNLGCN
ncbi:MAG: tol-pal system protein YbgF [Alphaproteobacteria bacterium]|nr:tol-pal system protein YbgF [Alphaproteobacteria bacterium]